jgi:hypothetical protein
MLAWAVCAKAIALCGLSPEDQLRHASSQGQIFGGVILAGAVGIFAELNVQYPMLAVLDIPVPTHRFGKVRSVNEQR